MAAARTATLLSLMMDLVLGGRSYFFAAPLLRVMGAEGQVLSEAVTCLRIVSTPSFLNTLMLIFGSILRAADDTRTPTNISLIINLIHIPIRWPSNDKITDFCAGAYFNALSNKFINT